MTNSRYDDHAIASPAVGFANSPVPSALDEYLFDLRGYLVLPKFLTSAEVAEGNVLIDAIPRDLPRGGWHGWVQREDHPEHRGISYQQVYELGGVFDRMIDHPRMLNLLDRFVGGPLRTGQAPPQGQRQIASRLDAAAALERQGTD